jgi:hypothetical protein
MRELIPARVRRTRRQKVKDLPDLPVADEVLDVSGHSMSDGRLPEED